MRPSQKRDWYGIRCELGAAVLGVNVMNTVTLAALILYALVALVLMALGAVYLLRS